MNSRFVDAVHHEIAEEKAGALGRSGRRLELAIETFRAHEQGSSRGVAGTDARRERLLWDVAERVEAFVVQREACGLRDSRHVLRFYDVPREAIARVGARRPPRCGVCTIMVQNPSREGRASDDDRRTDGYS